MEVPEGLYDRRRPGLPRGPHDCVPSDEDHHRGGCQQNDDHPLVHASYATSGWISTRSLEWRSANLLHSCSRRVAASPRGAIRRTGRGLSPGLLSWPRVPLMSLSSVFSSTPSPIRSSAQPILVMTLVGLLLWAQVLGLPRWLALILGIGLTSRPLRFSNRLSDLRKPIKALSVADPAHLSGAIKNAEAQIRRVRALRAPDPAWAAVRDDLADCDSRWIDLVRADASNEHLGEQLEAYAPVMARWTELRDRAASDQRQLATPARRRRGAIVWYGSVGFSAILLGVAQVQALDVPPSGLGDRHFWAVALPFIGALILFGMLASTLRQGRA